MCELREALDKTFCDLESKGAAMTSNPPKILLKLDGVVVINGKSLFEGMKEITAYQETLYLELDCGGSLAAIREAGRLLYAIGKEHVQSIGVDRTVVSRTVVRVSVSYGDFDIER